MNKLLYSPHAKAPLFEEEDFSLLIKQAIDEIESGRFSTGNETIRELFREAGFVNLWFFLKFIAGYAGPFDKLNDTLHVDMANFRQVMMVPGKKAASFIGRRHYKSTIYTSGANAWMPLRDPECTIELFSCIKDRSYDFLHTTQRIYDANEFFAWLYPEYVIIPGVGRNNSNMMDLPNKTKYTTEPTLRPHGVGCSTQGIHGNIVIDDPIGDAQLNAERESNMDMQKIGNWLKSNVDSETLLKDDKSQVFYTATRYGIEDAHTFIFKNATKLYGYWDDLGEDIELSEENEWHIHNRGTVENGVITFPENFNVAKIEKMKTDDPWTYFTQYANDPKKCGLNELNEYKVQECELGYEQGIGWTVSLFHPHRKVVIGLSSIDLVIAIDPGATERRQTSKTSKTAVGVIGRDSANRYYVLKMRSGYVKTSKGFEWGYSFVKQLYNYFRATILEAQGGFKLLPGVWKDLLKNKNDDAVRHNEPVYNMRIRGVNKVGEKKAVIRNTLQPILKEGQLYVEKGIVKNVQQTINTFPFGTLDELDMISLGIRSTIRPPSARELAAKKKREDRFKRRHANAAGY